MKWNVMFLSFLFSTLESNSTAEFVEGDIAYRDDDKQTDDGQQSAFLWHRSTNWVYGTVPYYIDEDSITNDDHRNLIKTVIEDIVDAAKCISFKDLAGKEKIGDHIRKTDLKIKNFFLVLFSFRIRAHGDSKNSGSGCWSYLGRQGGEQVVNLGQGCMKIGTITHELLHALGQVHEHTRPDRDENVEIMLENVESNKAQNFKKREKGSGPNQVVHMDASYDMYSLLHYPSYAWSKDNKSETIRPINKQYKRIGGTDGMTATDIIELNLRYGCSDISTPLVVDYIHEVEHKATMELKNMAIQLKEVQEGEHKANMEIQNLAGQLKDVHEDLKESKAGNFLENENLSCDQDKCRRYKISKTETPSECQALCKGDDKCRFFVWHKKNGNKHDNWCYGIEDSLGQVAKINRAPDRNCISGTGKGFLEVQILRQPHFASVCAFKRIFSKKGSTVTYDKLVTRSSNLFHETNTLLNLASGKYSVPIPGVYRIDYSLTAWHSIGDAPVFLHVRKNEKPIPESKHDSDSGTSEGVADKGGASLLLQLEKGDKVDLFCTDCSAVIGFVLFCINLEHVDLEKALGYL